MAKVSLRAYNRDIETMIDRGQFDEAIAHCRHILKTYPKHLETYRLLGKGYLESKRYGDAMDIFSRILATVPNDFVAQVGMSIIRDEENKLDDAIWHMERAFETQPSNPAIQSELQRLYAQRDGVRPPRIRMTRGALANMYVQGELYPQAISEIKSVLKDDPERADMQALLARACYRSGLKNDAADVASSLLRRYPYSLDANRVLVEILGSEHPETTQIYRQRVFELDPYAAQVTASIFLANEVSDAAVNLERLDWNGQPVALQPDWAESRAISPETGEQPDWLSKPVDETSLFGANQSAPGSIYDAPPEEPSTFGGLESAPTPPTDEIPAFMRAAGWGAATGAFDESKSVFGEEEAKPAESIEQGDLPEWVKAMKPAESKAPAPEQEEELPDWIKTIGVGAIAAQAFDRDEKKDQVEPPQTTGAEETTQWLSSESTFGATSEDDLSSEFAWLKNLDEPEVKSEDPDWLKSLEAGEAVPSTPQEEPDWLKGLQKPESKAEDIDLLKDLDASEAVPSQAQEPDWLKALGESEAVTAANQTEEPDWLKSLGGSEAGPSVPHPEEPDWLKGPSETEATPAADQAEEPDWLKGLGEPESMPSGSEDKPDWLKGLAFASGVEAISHLAQEDEPEETKETPLAPMPAETSADSLNQLTEEPILEVGPESTPPAMDAGQLGTSEQERDDSFAWLEGLAAKQGATEGLLTKPEERLEEEPEWVKQAKGLKSEPPVSQPSAEQPLASVEDLGKSDQDDAFAWLEGLATKQGATESLLTQPEERLEEEPEWVKRAKDLNGQESQLPAAVPSEVEQEQPAAVDEVDDWLKNLEGEQQIAEPAAATDATAIWLKGLDQEETFQAEEPVETPGTDLPEWMKNIQEAPEEKSATIFAEEAELSSTWMPPTEEPAPTVESKAEEEALPSWLGELENEEEQTPTPTDAGDLPAWLLAEEAAPAAPEPTIFSDWKPVEETREQTAEEQPEPLMPHPTAPFEMAEAETVLEPEQPQAEPELAPVMDARETAPEPEPVVRPADIPTVDPMLAMARNELSANNVSGALGSYDKLIKKARFLDEVIYDLREALYRYPVDVGLWQSLGDAYMRANRLQDALDAYTKAEELLR
jgi:tetratricopeptide (TPR) repeat protein